LARGQERQPKEAAFVRVAAVKMPASAVGTKRIELVVSEGLRIRVWEGFDAATLRRVLDVVRER
jgi:primosomal replication protein N